MKDYNLEQHKRQSQDSVSGVPGSKVPNNNRSLADYLRLLFWIVLVVAIGMVAVNQTFEFYYKAEFLKTPCALCLELNPEVSKQCFIKEDKLYPNAYGGWQYENGSQYNK